jgi:hypothetical protein
VPDLDVVGESRKSETFPGSFRMTEMRERIFFLRNFYTAHALQGQNSVDTLAVFGHTDSRRSRTCTADYADSLSKSTGNQRGIDLLTVNVAEQFLDSARLRRIVSIHKNLRFCSLCRLRSQPRDFSSLAYQTSRPAF